ncbi:MAG: pentapeptide repeat-containing protein [Gammaproteobacteria bacterium]
MTHTKNWFIRRKSGPIKGPFPTGQIEQYLLLGRFILTDEVSLDRVEWKKISSIPHLIPEILVAARYDEGAQQKLASKKRWADERRGLNAETPEGERRHIETKGTIRHDLNEIRIKKQKMLSAYIQIFFVIILISVIAFLSFRFMPDNVVSIANCSQIPGPSVNWTNCQRVGLELKNVDMHNAMVSSASLTGATITNVNFSNANLSYTELSISQLNDVDFSNSVLLGAILKNSKLYNVNFSNSDLRYMNLTGATLINTNFSKANLENAIWIDGRVCAKKSIGKCL